MSRPARRRQRSRNGGHWRFWQRALTTMALVVFLALLAKGVQQLDWVEIHHALSAFGLQRIGLGFGLALLVLMIPSSYDLIGRRYTAHQVPAAQCMSIGFSAYAFSMSVSALLGSWGARVRLYQSRGVPLRKINRIAVVSVLSGWLGLLLLSGLVFTWQPPPLPSSWPLHTAVLRGLGLGLLALCAAYLWLCHHSQGRSWRLRGAKFSCPSLPLALAQFVAGSGTWLGMSAVLAFFLPDAVPFTQVMAALFLSAGAGLVVRLPAGVGVIETVCIAVLGPQVGVSAVVAALVVRLPAGVGVIETVCIAVLGPQVGVSAVVAALVVYRVLYYLLPLLLALAVYALLEWRSPAGSTTRQETALPPLEPRKAWSLE